MQKKNIFLILLLNLFLLSCSLPKKNNNVEPSSTPKSSPGVLTPTVDPSLPSPSDKTPTIEPTNTISITPSISANPTEYNTPDPTPSLENYEDQFYKSYDELWDNNQEELRYGSKHLSFYNLNDTHGAIMPNGYEPGISKLSSFLLDKKKDNSDGFVLTSSGDMWQGSADSNLTKGCLMIDWMDYLEFDAMEIGNHEFDWGIDTIKANKDYAGFPFLGSNIVYKDTGKLVDFAVPYHTITRNGVHIGIIGTIGDIKSSILASITENIDFIDQEVTVSKWSNYLKENGADIILYLTHDSTKNVSSQITNYIDLGFGGHSHQIENNTVNGVRLLQASYNGRGVGEITLDFNFDDSSITNINTRIYTNEVSSYDFDLDTEGIITMYEDTIEAIKNEPIGYTDKYVSKDDLVGIAEQCMYQFFLDYIDITYPLFRVSHNQARSYLNAGVITYGDLYRCFPFDNSLVLCTADPRHADDYSYTSFYPVSNNPDDVSVDGECYILTINYLAEHETYGQYLDIVQTFDYLYVRDIIKQYIGNYFPMN